MSLSVHTYLKPHNEMSGQSSSLEQSEVYGQNIIERMRARMYQQSDCSKLITMGVQPAIKWLSSDFAKFLESTETVCKLQLLCTYKEKVRIITQQVQDGCFSELLKASDFVQDIVSSVFDRQLNVTYCEVSRLIKNKTSLQQVASNYQVSCESMIEVLQYASFNEWVGNKTFKVSVESNSVVRSVFHSLMGYFQPELICRRTMGEKASLWYSKGAYDDLLVPFWKGIAVETSSL